MKAYRYITGPDDASFCHRITRMLNQGWSLAGPSTLTFDAEQKRVICGQALMKERLEVGYVEGIDLSDF